MVTTVVDSIATAGRHRYGAAGLVHVRLFATVTERSIIARLLGLGRKWGRHHEQAVAVAPSGRESTVRLVPAGLV